MNPNEYRQALQDYYAMKKAHEDEVDSLTHWGIKGMKWGDRKYQYKDGSLTPEGRERYGVGDPREKAKLKMEADRQKLKLEIKRNKAEAKLQMKMDRAAAKNDAIRIKAEQYAEVKNAKEETKQKKIGMKPEVIAEKTEKRNSSFGKKLVMAGIATAAVIGVAYALKRSSGSPEIAEKAAKGSKVLKENTKVKGTLASPVKEVVKSVNSASSANSGKSSASARAIKGAVTRKLNKMDPSSFITGPVYKRTNVSPIGNLVSALKDRKMLKIAKAASMAHSNIRVRRIPKEAYNHVIT